MNINAFPVKYFSSLSDKFINKEIQGKTLVLPDTAEKLFGRFGKKLQAMSNRGELVKMEDTELFRQSFAK